MGWKAQGAYIVVFVWKGFGGIGGSYIALYLREEEEREGEWWWKRERKGFVYISLLLCLHRCVGVPPFFEGGMCLLYSLDGQLLSNLCLFVLNQGFFIKTISMGSWDDCSPQSRHTYWLWWLAQSAHIPCLHACVRDNCSGRLLEENIMFVLPFPIISYFFFLARHELGSEMETSVHTGNLACM